MITTAIGRPQTAGRRVGIDERLDALSSEADLLIYGCDLASSAEASWVLRYLDPSSVIPERVKLMLDTMAEGVLVLDERERIVLANNAFVRASGVPTKELIGKNASELPWQSSESDETGLVLPWARGEQEGISKGEALCLKRADGDVPIFVVNTTPIEGGDGAYRGAPITFDDVSDIEEKNTRLEQMVRELKIVRTKVEKQNDELRHMATRDALTGCLNRRALFETLESTWASSNRYAHGLACIMLDIDRFKSINDTHGHGTGDEVLQRFAAVLEGQTRTTDTVGRYGGEEFCIVLPHTGIDEAANVAEKILRRGHDIPFRARILTVADSYDAMASDRVYRKGMSQEDAFAELTICAGTQFDPEIVTRFIEVVSARDKGRTPSEPDKPMEVMLRLGLASERLAGALEVNDLRTLTLLPAQLSEDAATHEWTEIAECAAELSTAGETGGEVADLLQSSRDLLDLCRSAQGEYISRGKAATARGAPARTSPGSKTSG